jgi:hypothetical protein
LIQRGSEKKGFLKERGVEKRVVLKEGGLKIG